MALTSEEFAAWLSKPDAVRCTLVEVIVDDGSGDKTLYLSNRNYATNSGDIPQNVTYLPVLASSVEFTETISLDGSATLSYGDIAIHNDNGEYDDWLNWVWSGRPIRIYMGDPKFERSDFTQIFSGIVNDIGSSDRSTLNLSIRDVIQRLNGPVHDTLLGPWGTKGVNNQNKESIRPLCFGEVHNITPLLVDDVELEYMVHDGEIEGILEVRDNGVPVTFTANTVQGTFKLDNAPYGTITCSVQGDKRYVDDTGLILTGYRDTVAKIIQRIITSYGKVSEQILPSELDLTNFNSYHTNYQQPVGVFISDKENIIDICQQLASSIGAKLVSNRLGQLKLVRLDVPLANSSVYTITDNDIIHGSLNINQKVPVVGAVKVEYCKNWTTQDNLVTGIPEEHKDLYTQEYLVKSVQDSSVLLKYKLSGDVTPYRTLLLSDAFGDVTNEATRLLNLYKVPRFTYTMTCVSRLISLKLGDTIILQHSRFGLQNGKPGQIISIGIDWTTGTTRLEVLV